METLKKIFEKLCSIKEHPNVVSVIACVVLVCIALWFYKVNRGSENVVITNKPVTEEVVTEAVLKSDTGKKLTSNELKEVSQEVTKKIEIITSTKQKPDIHLDANASSSEIKAAVESTKPSSVIVQTDVPDVVGTNIYSIKVSKAEHGLGFYGSFKDGGGNAHASAGIHYRNKRWTYQIGMDKDGKGEARIAYEALQW